MTGHETPNATRHGRPRLARWGLVALVLVVLSAPANAQESPAVPSQDTSAPGSPWSRGVPPAARKRALAVFEEGNLLFSSSQYSKALAKYRAALEHWDHPSIRFNMVVCLVNLDQPLEAHEHLTAAMQYGEGPLGRETFAQARTYRKLLDGRLAQLEVRCEQPGAEVALDGNEFLRCPGRAARTLMPGAHQLVASKPGFLTLTRALVLVPGDPAVENIDLLPLDSAIEFERRWAAWKPWAVVGGGAAAALIGGGLMIRARSTLDSYNEQFASLCPTGCPTDEVPDAVTDLERRATTENAVGISAVAVGGAAVLTGVALVIWNRPRAVERSEGASSPDPSGVVVLPVLGSGVAGLSAVARF